MNKIILLTNLFTKNIFEDMFSVKNKDKFSMFGTVAIIALMILISSIPVAIIVINGYEVLSFYNSQSLVLEFIIIIASLLVLVFGILMVLNVFFFSKDIEVILPLPINPGEIIVAKLLSCLIYMYVAILTIMPSIICFGILEQRGIIYYINTILIIFIMPIFPLCLSGTISLILMRFSNLAKSKNLAKVIMSLFGIIIAVSIQFITPVLEKISVGDADFLEESKLSYINDVIVTGKTSFMALWSDGAESILYLGITFLMSILAIIVFYYIAQVFYIKGAMGSGEVYSKRRVLSKEQIKRKLKKRSELMNLIFNDFRMIFRTPAYFIGTLATVLVMPIVILFIYIQTVVSGINHYEDTFLSSSTFDSSTKILIVVGLAIFMAGLNPIGPTIFSREGQEFYIRKYLPISYKTQILAKYAVTLIVNIISYIIIVICAVSILKLDWIIITLASIVSILAMTFVSAMGIIIDIRKPKLIWDNEQTALKNNMNLFKSMMLSYCIIAIIILIGIITSSSLIVMVITETIVLAIGTYINVKVILSNCDEHIESIE